MATIKSSNTLLSEVVTFLRAYNRTLDTSANSLTRDLIITPYGIGARLLAEQLGIVRDLHILSKQKNEDLDDEATNYNLERSRGTFAAVTLTFWTETLPTADIIIPAGTQARTTGTSFSSPLVYSTIADTSISASNAAAYYSYDRARYEFSVDALAAEIGTASNVAAGLINILTNAVSQISGVTNLTGAVGGSGVEDDDDFRERIKTKKTGRDLNTINGIREYVRESGFIDAYPVRVESADAERATGIDIFVIDQRVTSDVEQFTYRPDIPRYYFTNTPVRDVTSVVSSFAGVLSSSDYDVNIDNSSPLRRSVFSQDYIEIRATASLPSGSTFTVTYTYSQNIINAQNMFDLDANNVLTADPLIKRAFPLRFYINATLTLIANADGPTTRNKARNALIQFLSAYQLGDNIQKSDIIIVLQQGYGDFPITSVDAVIINEYYLQDEFGVNYLPIDETISVSNKQYVIYGAATIV